MRIVIADYSGHPFQVQLSRELSRRGHHVLHLYFAEFQTPKGRLELQNGDPGTLGIESISLGRTFAKYNFLKRRFQEIDIGRKFSTRIAGFRPDAVIGSNLPLDTLRIIQKSCRRAHTPFIFWQQDIYSIAITRILQAKYGLVGRLIGRFYRAIEARALLDSDAVVVISPDFVEVVRKTFGIATNRLCVVENWAPLDEITPEPRDNCWVRAQNLLGREIVLYTGTLGLKHNPDLILALSEALRARPAAVIIVASEGPAADWLAQQAQARGLPNLRVMGFQPYSVYPEVLASADVLISILESDSGSFSVPSKVLSYLCAGRAVVMSGPGENLAARILAQSGSGTVVPANDVAAFARAVADLLTDKERCQAIGRRGRAFAEIAFNISHKADQFEAVLSGLAEIG